jgi:hypothetical protein
MATQTRNGASVTHRGRTLIPVARSFLLRLPGQGAGLVWNRPVGVHVEDSSGARSLRITDPTRRIQLGLLAAGVAAAFVVSRVRSRRRRPRLFARFF